MEDILERPLFSIATPCWNSEKSIERTIRSVLSQNYTNYEYIIVDGGSTDRTIDIIKKYEPLFQGRLHWKSEPDKGIYDAFNKGVNRSRGIYCWNVNSDDFMEPNALESISTFISSLKDSDKFNSVIVGDLRFVNSHGEEIELLECSDDKAHQAYKDNFMIPHPATIVPKKIYELYGAFDTSFKVAGDMDWFNRVYAKGVKFVFIHKVLTNMSIGGVTYTQSFTSKFKEIQLLFRHKYGHGFMYYVNILRWLKRLCIIKVKKITST